jgi:hypothetical protein
MAMEIQPDRGQSDFDRNFLFALGVKAPASARAQPSPSRNEDILAQGKSQIGPPDHLGPVLGGGGKRGLLDHRRVNSDTVRLLGLPAAGVGAGPVVADLDPALSLLEMDITIAPLLRPRDIIRIGPSPNRIGRA